MPEAQDSTSLAHRQLEEDSRALRDRTRWAIRQQADAWGIRFDQTQALLLDRKVIA